MKLHWAHFKKYESLPDRYKCCIHVRAHLQRIAGKEALLDLDCHDTLEQSCCLTCGQVVEGTVLGFGVVYAPEAPEHVGMTTDVEMFEIDPNPAEVQRIPGTGKVWIGNPEEGN